VLQLRRRRGDIFISTTSATYLCTLQHREKKKKKGRKKKKKEKKRKKRKGYESQIPAGAYFERGCDGLEAQTHGLFHGAM
jgi:hypothetical protein